MSLNDVQGEPNWIELFTTDPDTATTFYGELFGWTVADPGPEYGGYQLFLRDGAPVAGLMRNDGQGVNAWAVYLESYHAADTVAMVEANGGRVVAGAHQVGELGHMAVVTDPSGAMIGIWQPLAHSGFAVRAEVNAPAWFEVLTSDYDAVIPFYESAFGWDTHTMSDTPDFRYTTLGKDDHAVAGIMAQPGPSHWNCYLAVADTDATLAQALELGGTQVTAPVDTPYGRLATIADPAGIELHVMGPSETVG